MKTTISLFLFCLSCALLVGCQGDNTSPVAAAPTPPAPAVDGQSYVPAGYKLVWNDEFDSGSLPDTTRWGYQTGGHGWTAKEFQLYTEADPINVGVENGMLRITAAIIPEKDRKRNAFSSTRMVTKKKATFEQGYFEVRAKFPEGNGLRSAIWMVGDTVSKIGWPQAGEIDLIEHYGKIPTVAGAAVQTPANFWNGKGQMGGAKIVKGITEDFHLYSCTWTDDLLTFAVDGIPYWEYRPLPGRGLDGWPFNWPFYLVMNVSVGGQRNAAVAQINPADFPASMYVDYVRVYQEE